MGDEVNSVTINPQDDLSSGWGQWSDPDAGDWYNTFFPIDLDADESNEVTMSPLESGIKHIDNKVFNPMKVDVIGYVPANKAASFKQKVYAGLKEMDFRKSLWTVTSKSSMFYNLLLVGIKETNEKDMYDNIKFKVSFIEALIDNDPFTKNNKGNGDTTDAGMMSALSMSDDQINQSIDNMLSELGEL